MLRISSLSDIYSLVTKRQLSVRDAVEIAVRRGRRRKRWKGWFDVEGSILGKPFSQVALNQLYDQGEQDVLEGFFRNATLPTDFKIGLLKTSYSILETDTMTQVAAQELTNASDGGYASRQTVTRDATGWPTSALVGGDWQLTSLQVVWTATGAWADTAGFMFLLAGGTTAPANTTGRAIAVAALNPTRQLQAVNDNLKVTYNLKLQ
jgi:hypothetical protein